MRERLIELLGDVLTKHNLPENIADYLLENGVIFPPCKVGDDLYWIDENNTVQCQKNAIKGVAFCGDKWQIIDTDDCVDDIGTRYTCLSREEAEAHLTGQKMIEKMVSCYDERMKGGAE